MTKLLPLEYGKDNEHIIKTRQSLLNNYFSSRSWWEEKYLDETTRPDWLTADIHRHAVKRYNETVEYTLPWCAKAINLADARLLEVGCGTGSSTSAFAGVVNEIITVDIDEPSTKVAQDRCKIFNHNNVDISWSHEDNILTHMEQKCAAESVDVVLMFAVLEHQTDLERLDSLEFYWSRLKKGGHLIIAETPNRLTYFDWHTSKMSFFHMLPKEIQLRYLDKVPRKDFSSNVLNQLDTNGTEAALNSLSRWGQSISYHDLEIVIGDLRSKTVLDGFEPEILAQRPIRPEETLLHNYFINKDLKMPLGYARYSIDVIIKK